MNSEEGSRDKVPMYGAIADALHGNENHAPAVEALLSELEKDTESDQESVASWVSFLTAALNEPVGSPHLVPLRDMCDELVMKAMTDFQ